MTMGETSSTYYRCKNCTHEFLIKTPWNLLPPHVCPCPDCKSDAINLDTLRQHTLDILTGMVAVLGIIIGLAGIFIGILNKILNINIFC